MSTLAPVHMDTGKADSNVRWVGRLRVPDVTELEHAVRDGWMEDGVDGWTPIVGPVTAAIQRPWRVTTERLDAGQVLFVPNPNLVVDVGVQRSLDRLFGISGPPAALETMGVDDGTTNPAADSLSSTNGNSGTDTGSTNRRLITYDSTPSRTANVVTADGTFTQATVSFTMKRLFLSEEEAGTTDADGTLYAMTNVFTMDLSVFTTWSQTFSADVTGAGS